MPLTLPRLGLGTCRLGEDPNRRDAEVQVLRAALEMGYRLFDTAEMYGDGGAEIVLGQALGAALRGGYSRESLIVVSKVYPHHASIEGIQAACDRSRQRLGLDCIDLYLLHWRGTLPLRETVEGMWRLQQRGWIRHWGVSNFDVADLNELRAIPGGDGCAANQIYYSLSARGIEFDLLPWSRELGTPLMAYSPIDQGALAGHAALQPIADRHGVTPAQVALAWVLRGPGVVAIPKAARTDHLRENWDAAQLQLEQADLLALDVAFAPPRTKQPLAMT